MMDTEDTLDAFLRNVSENLLDQGYFIGTCFDGRTILEEMGRHPEITGEIDGQTVYVIRKALKEPGAYKNITVGNKINVYNETFGSMMTENLVNISYLKEKAKEHSLKLIEFKSFTEEPGNLLSQYEVSSKKSREYTRQIRQSEAMMTWAKFSSYFMFQKVRKVE